jgi:acylphosphatase
VTRASSCRRVVVRGLVQGVGFRVSLAQRAEALDVAGWVRNRPDGAVEALLEGAHDSVDSLVRWCEHGPRGAGVDGVEVHDEAVAGLSGFRIAG